MKSKIRDILFIDSIKKRFRRFSQNKPVGYCFLLSLLLLCLVICFFFSSYVLIEMVLVILLLTVSFIGPFVEKNISNWVIFVISIAIGIFFFNVVSYEEELPKEKEISAAATTLRSEYGNDSMDVSKKETLKDFIRAIDETNLLENSKKVISPYLDKKSDWLAIILSLISLIYVVYTWRSQDKTQKNTQRITPEIQKGIFKDLFRHSYRNLIILAAIRIRLRKEGYDRFYPAEYHLTKLQTEEGSIYPEVFVDNEDYCGRLHEMKLVVRNGNFEIKEVLEHLKNPKLESKYKERGIDLINQRINTIMDRTWTILKEQYGMDENNEIPAQILDYMFERPSNASENARKKHEERINCIVDTDDPEKKNQFEQLCAENTPESGIIDYSKFIDILYPREKSGERGERHKIDDVSDSSIKYPKRIDDFVKRINAEIFISGNGIHLLPFK